MFILKHGTREDKPYLMSAKIGVTGIDISFSEERGAIRFVSRAVAMQVGKALRSFGNFYVIQVKR
ncbi:hypothetical protein [Streptococcus oralis]|jgi:hypothetical protein|uniref:hypothetical protein n=1 Tax=Streptococcus oralis TaxID=1303 RepID=UPI001CBF200F|nr:hypothetical protein [Streptococcus oralis]MBZ2085768.1 hypothetical protein [Streptococcus oralis]MBZ2089357.1 hypothetical protein [Streptococcus oralis]DAU42523.1 MAG TPA: hypothetical protein [Caudoviricetes sp.]